MDDIELAILKVWRRIRPRLARDMAELKRRLARRQKPSLSRPPRAWCLAIRASDRRLNAYLTSDFQVLPSALIPLPSPQSVYVDADLLTDLCRPVSIYQQTWDEAARKLGVGFTGLHTARISGRLRSNYVRGLEGRWGPPVPLLCADAELDPNARGLSPPDPIWSWTTRHLVKRIPDELGEYLTREPVFASHTPRRHFDDTLHPEMIDAPRTRKARPRLPPAPPDHVWYKWTSKGEYLGDDPRWWRKGPDDPGIPPSQRPKPTAWPWDVVKKKRRRKSRPSRASGSLVFRGWTWICPKCGKKVKVLYLPVQPINLIENYEEISSDGVRSDGVTVSDLFLTPSHPTPSLPTSYPTPSPRHPVTPHGLACHSCHRIRSFSRIDNKNNWNEVISYVSGGLLYGHEVPKPASHDREAQRKVEYRARLRAAPRRQQVLRRMLNGWTITQITADLKMCKQQVCDSIRKLCRQEGVNNRRELAQARIKAFSAAGFGPEKNRGQKSEIRHRSAPSCRLTSDLRPLTSIFIPLPFIISSSVHRARR